MVVEEAGTYGVILRSGSCLPQGRSDSSSWKSSSPLLQTSFVIQANSWSCCAFLVRNFGETIGKKEEMGNSHDSQLTCQKTQSTIQAILHLYSGQLSQKECKLTLLMEPCLDKIRRGSQGQHARSLSTLIAVEVTTSSLSPRVELLQTTIYLSNSVFFFLTSLPHNQRNFSSNYLSMQYTIG